MRGQGDLSFFCTWALEGRRHPLILRRSREKAGVPTSGFLANLYLMEMDFWFGKRGIPYIRYSDDIPVFAKSEEERTEYESVIREFFDRKKLTVNPAKEVRK